MNGTIGTLLGAVEPLAQTASDLCTRAYNDTLTAALGDTEPTTFALYEARKAASQAWHKALPRLTTRRAIHAYIACVAVGQELEIITGKHARELLYSAQLALTALTKRPGRKATKK